MKKILWNSLKLILGSVTIAILTYVYIGFYFPDPTILTINWIPKFTLWTIRVLFPLFVAGVFYICYLLYKRKVKPGSVVLLALTLFFCFLIFYPVADYLYRKSISTRLNEIHSYLQIMPQEPNKIDSKNINIFCLGGSTTEFKDNKDRDWPSLLEKELNEKYRGKNIKVYNFGKQWYTTQHILINYIQNLSKYKPNILLVMENINDLLHNADFSIFSKGGFREDYGNFLGPLTRIVKQENFIDFMVNTVSHLWYQGNFEEIKTDKFPGLVSFERNLITLSKLAKSDGVTLILMTQPNLYKDSMTVKELSILDMLNTEAIGGGKKWAYKTALEGLRKYNSKIIEVANMENLTIIDLEAAVPKNTDYFYDDVHYNSRTYDLIAKQISEQLNLSSF